MCMVNRQPMTDVVPPPPNNMVPLGNERVGTTEEGRPIIKNSDGSISTERTATELVDGKWRNFPTMFGGKQVDVDAAIEIMRKNNWKDPETGKPTPTFDSLKEAEAEAKSRSKSLGKYNKE